MTDDAPPSLLIEPAARGWRVGIAREHGAARRALGLPDDRAVIMTGHQAVFWHPGILAKYIAADAAARALGASPAWVVVDQDTEDPWAARVPVRDERGHLRARALDLRGGGAAAGDDVPVCRMPAAQSVSPAREEPAPAVPSVAEGLSRVRAALAAHSGAANAARQVGGALRDLLEPLVAPAPMVYATELARTEVFAAMVRAMAEDPRACVLAYNAAARAAPGAGLRALAFNETNEVYELPLWRIGPGGARRKVYAEDLGAIPAEELGPRALMMTAVLRAAFCDLFIHGTGGSVYERATDAWVGAWMPAITLAPVCVVSATLRLALTDRRAPTGAELARARWLAHRARHDPGVAGDERGASRRRELVAAVKSARRENRDIRAAFGELHRYLAERRAANGATLSTLDREVQEMLSAARDAEVANDRTWPFPFYPGRSLDSLRDAIAREFGA